MLHKADLHTDRQMVKITGGKTVPVKRDFLSVRTFDRAAVVRREQGENPSIFLNWM
ncbi:hypothetical protein [Desulfopila sp. IMCC35006]|uniref:hypothetical protein n=1 Tax=Desulfopila sp. IMCC35006 TaxID=2569542 RepID=UPI0012947310|nr:hypothetical protein [Desulfopila sp. IMCC35006]